MSEAITVRALSKVYGSKRALSDVSLAIPKGMIYGLIGPNGAGKTTTLAILGGLLAPTSGSVEMSVPPNRVGFYSPQFESFDYLTGREILFTHGRLHGIAKHDLVQRADDLLGLLDLRPAADHYLYEYSLGMRQKLGLAAALIHAPEIALLDEPFDGLDTSSAFRIIKTIQSMRRRGRTILLTSHDLALVERVCERVGILHNGALVREFDLSATPAESKLESRDLESMLWDVVGMPTYEELTWI